MPIVPTNLHIKYELNNNLRQRVPLKNANLESLVRSLHPHSRVEVS